MRKNVLVKKNKILALALAAAMVFTSAPMQSVYAEEANGTVTENVSQKEASDGEVQKEAADGEGQKEVSDGEAQKEATDGESQKEVTDGEAQKEVTDGETQKETTDGEAQKEVADGESQEEAAGDEVVAFAAGDGEVEVQTEEDGTEEWTTLLNMSFGDEGKTDVQAADITVVGTVNKATTKVGGNSSQKLFLGTKGGTVTYKLGEGYKSGKVKIVVETYSTLKNGTDTADNKNNGQLGFRVLDTGEGENQHALINIGHFGGVNLYTTDVTGAKSATEKNETDSSKYKDLQYLSLMKDSDANRGRWIRLETVIDLDNSTDILDFKTTVYRKNTADDEWVEHKSATGATYNLEEGAWEKNGTTSMVKPVAHTKGCANDDAVLEVGAIVFDCVAANAYVDNIYIGATDAVALKEVQVTQSPDKTTYTAGDQLDLTGMKLTETYTKGEPKVLSTVDEIKAAYNITGFNSTETGEQTITVTSKANPEIKDTFKVTVEAAAEIVGLKEILSYKGEIDDVAELGFTDKDGALSLSTTGVAGNTSQKLLIGAAATVKKDLKYYGLSEGVVKINLELNQNAKNAEYRILDADGKALINFGQFSNTNIYYGNQTGGKLSDGKTGTAYKTVISGTTNSNKKDWLRFETEIDLDASNTSGSLQFKTVIYCKDSYEKDWVYKATVTGEDYKSVDGWAAAKTDSQEGATAHTNGCATDGFNKFSVGSIELAANGASVAIDNIEILATDPAALQKIVVKDKPTKEEYIVDAETPEWAGLVLTETYSNGKNVSFTEDLTLDEIEKKYDITGFDTETAGTKTITVKSKDSDVSTTFVITVKDIKITGITIEDPTTKVYYVGDTKLDLTGLVVKATYSDNTIATLLESEYDVSALKAEAAGTETITVTSKAKNVEGKTVTATFEVTIKQPKVESIKVTKMPSKLSYKMKEEVFNPAGMEITATYDSGKTAVIDTAKCTITGFDNSEEAASQTITVLYEGKTDTFTIKIVDPSKFEPIEYNFDFNIDGSKTGSGWTGIFVNKKDGKNKGLSDYGFNAEKGYGINTTVTALDGRNESVTTSGDYVSIPGDVYKDFVLFKKANGSFDVVLENGTYNVQIVVGSTEGGTTEIKINNNSAYTGKASNSKGSDSDFKVIEIGGVTVTDGKMSFVPVNDSLARTNAIIISNISAPTGLTGEFKANDLSVSLSWGDSLGCEKYNVYRIGADGNIKCVAKNVEGTSYADTDIAIMETYTYYVRGVSAKGLETFATDKVKVTAGDENIAKPETPTNLTISDITSDSVTLTWDAVANASSYEIYWSDRDRTSLAGTKYATDGIEDYELIGTSKSNTFVLDLPTHIVRYFKVKAVGAGGKSGLSELVKADIVKEFNTQAEYLDRGLIAINTDYGIYLGWRLAGDEYAKNASYILYRDGAPIRTFTADQNTNYLDTDGTLESKYAVSVVIGGTESEKCEEVSVWANPYLEVPMDQPEPYYDDKLTKDTDYLLNDHGPVTIKVGDYAYVNQYKPNDTYIGDVDGDGQYELIVKWDGVSQDSSYKGYTSPVIIDCYKLDGTKLWRIDLGINIRAGAHYTQPVVADLDGDGKAEVMMKTAEGSKDGKGNYVDGNTNPKDYRNSSGHISGGPEYLTLFDGETGEVLDNIDYVPQRGSVSSWGDSAYNRSERYLSGAAYLDGEHMSAVFGRGYYKKSVVAAFDVVDKKIVQRWVCSSDDEENKSLFGQGAHSFTVADVDGDGCQEILYGSATIDHDGKLLYSLSDKKASSGSINGGHGDAERVTDMNLKNPGLEAFMVHEEHPNDGNVEMHDAGTGEYIYAIKGDADVGRGAAGDIDPRYEGVESWGNGSGDLGKLRAADGTVIGDRPSPANHMAWFNAGMGRKFVDHSYTSNTHTVGSNKGTEVLTSTPYIAEWDYENGKVKGKFEIEGCESNNTTKGNPCFQADIFGDWREEIAWRTDDNQAIRIYTSWEEQDFRLYTLMHDPTYRAQMSCEGSAYNQSPDAGFYIGYDTDLIEVPVPTLNILKAGEIPEPDETPEPDDDETPEPDATPDPDATPEPGATATPEPGATPVPGTEPSPTPGTEPTTTPDEEPDEEPDETPTATEAPSASVDLRYNVITAIPETIMTEVVKAATGCNTVAALTEYMKQDLVAKAQSVFKDIVPQNTEVREVAVNITLDGGKTWQPVTKETFPAGGIKIVLPYPEGTNKDEYDFIVSHLITIDRDDLNLKAGTIVSENYVKTNEGLELNIMSASPFAIGWSKIETTGDDAPDKTAPAKTGDNMYGFLWMWAVILVGAGCMMAFIVVKRRKDR